MKSLDTIVIVHQNQDILNCFNMKLMDVPKGKVIILNGPPSSGKDAIAAHIQKHGICGMSAKHAQVKETLFEQVLALTQIPADEWYNRYNDRDLKEKPWDRIGGLSVRELMIKMSEEYTKPIMGKDFYGKEAGVRAQFLINAGFNVAFSDGGFQEEFNQMKKLVGKENILLVRLHRAGCTFKGDSRSHLSNPEFEMDLHNNDSISNAVQLIDSRLREGYFIINAL